MHRTVSALLIAVLTAVQADEQAERGPVSHWDFDGGKGDVPHGASVWEAQGQRFSETHLRDAARDGEPPKAQ